MCVRPCALHLYVCMHKGREEEGGGVHVISPVIETAVDLPGACEGVRPQPADCPCAAATATAATTATRNTVHEEAIVTGPMWGASACVG